jgi:hypothetical protein
VNPISSDLLPGYDGDYQFEMSAAHRKPAYEIGTPSITWRMAFWKPAPKQRPISDAAEATTGARKPERGNAKSFEEHDQWILQIEYLILNIYDLLKEHRKKAAKVFANHPGMGKIWDIPEVSNLQPSKPNEPEYLRLLRRKFLEECPNRGRWDQSYEYLDIHPPTQKHCKTRYEAVHVDGVWESMPLDIRFEVSDEYFTLTTTIDFSRIREFRGIGDKRRRRRSGEFVAGFEAYDQAREAMFAIISGCNDRRNKMATSRVPESKRGLSNDLRDSCHHLYYGIWNALQTEIFSNTSEIDSAARLGLRFVDFRNLSLRCSGSPGRIVNPWVSVEGANATITIASNPLALKDKSKRDTVMDHSFKTDDLEWVDTIHPILLSIEDKMVNEMASDPVEYTFTKFCRERCIYGSGFGPQIEGNGKLGDPLTYILLTGFDEHREMGRLVNRLNTLGTLRMAAIYDLRSIKNECDYRLNDIENDLEEIQGLISQMFAFFFQERGRPRRSAIPTFSLWLGKIWKNVKELWQLMVEIRRNENWKQPPGSLKFHADLKKILQILVEIEKSIARKRSLEWGWFRRDFDEVARLLTDVHNELGYLDGVDRDTTDDNLSLGHVPLRAWRSKYYRERFDGLSKALNSMHIEGYQPYDVFLEHRLARAYSVIDLVAHHFAEAQQREIRLRKEWMAMELEDHQTELIRLQTVGETFFFLVLLPYYAHYIVLAFYQLSNKTNTTMNMWRAVLHGPPNENLADQAVLRMCFIVSLCVLLFFRPSSILKLGHVAKRSLQSSLRLLIYTFNKFSIARNIRRSIGLLIGLFLRSVLRSALWLILQ